MTSKQQPHQAQPRGRAVWLARLPATRSQDHLDHRDRRSQASNLARARGVDIVGEFLISSAEHEHLPDHVWSEVLDFLDQLRAQALVVLEPHEIAIDASDYVTRTTDLEAAGVRLLLETGDTRPRPGAVAHDEQRAA